MEEAGWTLVNGFSAGTAEQYIFHKANNNVQIAQAPAPAPAPAATAAPPLLAGTLARAPDPVAGVFN